MHVTESNDLDYVREVLSTPGMRKLCSAGLQCGSVDDVLAISGVRKFFVAWNGENKMGFISFHVVSDGTAQIHVALKTVGNATLEAVNHAIKAVSEEGINIIYAIFPANRKSITKLCDTIGFITLPQYNYEGVDFAVRKLTTT